MTRREFRLLLAVYLTGLIIGTFMDLRISLSLHNARNIVGRMMNVGAMLPAAVIMSYCSGIVYWYCRSEYPMFRYPAALLPFMAGVASFREIGMWRELDLSVRIIVGLIIGIVIIAVFNIRKPVIYRDKFLLAGIILLAAIASSSCIGIMKFVWGRRRYYAMDDPLTQFVPWYQLHPFASSDLYRSFPSGHTGFGSLVLFLVYLPEMTDLKINRNLLRAISIGWILVVMYSRIIYGAHFLSDVSCGAIIGLVVYYSAQKEVRKLTEFIDF